jgi:hypothetical protein
VQAIALEASVNELIDAIFGCYSSSKAADVVPKWAAQPFGTKAQHATLLMH